MERESVHRHLILQSLKIQALSSTLQSEFLETRQSLLMVTRQIQFMSLWISSRHLSRLFVQESLSRMHQTTLLVFQELCILIMVSLTMQCQFLRVIMEIRMHAIDIHLHTILQSQERDISFIHTWVMEIHFQALRESQHG